MIRRKICMLGASAVGKTSLVARFVHGTFSDKYLTTIGVKIDKCVLDLAETEVGLVLWDLNGEDEFQRVRASYIRAAAGYFLVVDPTRPATLGQAQQLHTMAQETIGKVPFRVVFNKADLESDWLLSPDDVAESFGAEGDLRECLFTTSAKSGDGVQDAFRSLAEATLVSES